MPSNSTPAPSQAVLWMAILTAALTLFTIARQTFHRPGTPFGDFAHLFLGAQCLLDRCDPYDAAALNRDAAARHQATPQVWAQSPVYPPSSLLVVLPFTSLGWPGAAIAFDLLAGLLFGCAAILMILRLNLGLQPASLLLLTSLVCNPILATLEFANPSLLAAALAAISAVLLLPQHSREPKLLEVAWLPLGLALALKPQLVVGIFVVIFCVKDTRRKALKAAALSLTLLLAACLAYRLRLGSFAYLAQLHANLSMSMLPGSTSDFSRANPESFDFLNLQTVLSRLASSSAIPLAWIITALLAALTLWLARSQRNLQSRVWTLLALAILISLIPVYHRGYDRVIALLLVAAAVELFAISRPLAWLYTAIACLWVANDTLMQHWLRRWHYAPQNPLEELVLCAILLASLRHRAIFATPGTTAGVGSIAE